MPLLRYLTYALLPVCTFGALYLVDRAGDSQVEAAAPIARSIDPFLGVQKRVLDKMASLQQVENADVPPAKVNVFADGCVISTESKAWYDASAVQAELERQYEKVKAELAAATGKPYTPSTPPASAEQDAFLLIESVNRYDLRAFDLSTFTSKERGGVFAALIKALPYEGGGDPTNLRFIEIWAASAETEKQKVEIRQFGQTGRMKYRLGRGQPSNPHWVSQRDTFTALREALLNAEDATNISMTTSYMVAEDGSRSEHSGELAQPKMMIVYGSTQDELQEQIDLLRAWKTEQGCE